MSIFFFKQKTAYEMRISDWSSDVCSSDLVCGMTVDPQKTAHHATHANHVYLFCSAGCRAKFVGDPEHYLIPAADRMVDTSQGPSWSCPIHTEIRQDHPCASPIHHMGLAPALVPAPAWTSAATIARFSTFRTPL